MTYRIILAAVFAFLPLAGEAMPPGKEGFGAVKRCVMENDAWLCHGALTPASIALFDRFRSYNLMPCLPTDFMYGGEVREGAQVVVKAILPAGGDNVHILRLVFAVNQGAPALDVPASFRRGLGENWENKVQLAEQIFLMMRQNMGDKLGCDDLNGLIKK